MVPELRKEEIMRIVNEKKVAYINDLAQDLGISTSTIRRDVAVLEQEGRVSIMRGGAVKKRESSVKEQQKKMENSETIMTESETLGLISSRSGTLQPGSSQSGALRSDVSRRAAALVEDGDCIYIDAGPAASAIIPYLKGKSITIVSGSTALLSHLPVEKARCILLGGEVREDTPSVLGALTEKMLSDLHFDKAFLEADGYGADGSIYVNDDREARKKVIIKENSDRTYVLMDESKKNKYAFVKVFEAADGELIL